MSNLSAALKSLLAKSNMTPRELARASEVSEQKISRWINDTQIYISDEDLEALALHVSTKPKERAELVVARLKDNLAGPGSEFVEISISGEPVRETALHFRDKLPAELLEAIPLFAQNWKDADVRNMIIGMKNLLKHGTCSVEVSSDQEVANDDKAVADAVGRDAEQLATPPPRRRRKQKK